jgi:hypothetical protein
MLYACQHCGTAVCTLNSQRGYEDVRLWPVSKVYESLFTGNTSIICSYIHTQELGCFHFWRLDVAIG